jgi:MFS family permease
MSKMTRFLKNPYYQIYVGILFCAGSFFVLIFAHSYSAFVVAMIILTVGEATAFPTVPAVVNMLSPQSVKGKYQGLTNAFSSVGKALGPLFGGLIIEGASYKILFIVCASSIVAVDIIIMTVVGWKKKHLTIY